jgi:hypothetical protein
MEQGNMLVSITLKGLDLASPIVGKVRGEVTELASGIDKLGMSQKAIGTGMGLIGSGVATGLIAAAASAAKVGSELNDMSARTGVSVEALSKLRYAAEQTGGDLGSVETGLKRLSIAAVSATQGGTTPGANALQELGISATVAGGRLKDPADLLVEVGGKLRMVENDATRTSIAVGLFGRSGTQLIPMFTDAKMSVADFAKEAEKLGLVMDTQTAAKMDELGDSIDRLKATAGKAFVELGIAVAPVLQQIADEIIPIVTNVIAWARANPELAASLGKAALGISAVMAVAGPLLVMLPGIATAAGWIATALGIGGAAGAAEAAAAGLAGVETAGAAAAKGMLGLSAAAGPIAAVIAALVLLGIELVKLKGLWDDTKKAAEDSVAAARQGIGAEETAANAAWRGGIEAGLKAERDAARPTMGERILGWITPGKTGQDIARERVYGAQASALRHMAGGGRIAGDGVAIVGEAGPELAVARGGGVEIIPLGRVPGFAGGGTLSRGQSYSRALQADQAKQHPEHITPEMAYYPNPQYPTAWKSSDPKWVGYGTGPGQSDPWGAMAKMMAGQPSAPYKGGMSTPAFNALVEQYAAGGMDWQSAIQAARGVEAARGNNWSPLWAGDQSATQRGGYGDSSAGVGAQIAAMQGQALAGRRNMARNYGTPGRVYPDRRGGGMAGGAPVLRLPEEDLQGRMMAAGGVAGAVGGRLWFGRGAGGGMEMLGGGAEGFSAETQSAQSAAGGGGRNVTVIINGPVYGAEGIREIAKQVFEEEDRAKSYYGLAVPAG